MRRADPGFHRLWLGLAAAVLLLSCVLRVDGTERVALPWIGQPLPGTCTYKRLFGVGCPGCGLTRCFVSMAHADWAAAWKFNPVGMILFAVVAAQLPYRGAQLWRIGRGQSELRWTWLSQSALWICVGALFLQWIIRTLAPGIVFA